MALTAVTPTVYPVRRTALLLVAGMALLYTAVQLAAAMATITFALVTGYTAGIGFAPALFLVTGALAALPAGRAMDRFGRMPVLAAGFLTGASGAFAIAFAAARLQAIPLVLGLMLLGAGNGTVMLLRLAAADLFPPAHRARGIGRVLMGAVVGALLGPVVFAPLFAGKALNAAAMVLPWIVAGGFLLLGAVAMRAVRPDPRMAARSYAPASFGAGPTERAGERTGAAPAAGINLRAILRRPGVLPAMIATQASVAVMVALMTLAGYVMVGHGHDQHAVFPAIAAHFVGMFGLMPMVGALIDRIGRTRALTLGLIVLAISTLALWAFTGAIGAALAMFGIGLGWNFAYVAATAELVDRTAAHERGRVLGVTDLVAGLSGALLAVLGGYGLHSVGLAAVCGIAALFALAPAVWIWRRPPVAVAIPQ